MVKTWEILNILGISCLKHLEQWLFMSSCSTPPVYVSCVYSSKKIIHWWIFGKLFVCQKSKYLLNQYQYLHRLFFRANHSNSHTSNWDDSSYPWCQASVAVVVIIDPDLWLKPKAQGTPDRPWPVKSHLLRLTNPQIVVSQFILLLCLWTVWRIPSDIPQCYIFLLCLVAI